MFQEMISSFHTECRICRRRPVDVYKRQTDHIGPEWITDLSQISKLKVYVDDEKAQQEFMNIKYQNKVRLAKYILEHNGVEAVSYTHLDVYKRQVRNAVKQKLKILKRQPGTITCLL